MFHIYRWIPAPFALPGMWEDYEGSSGLDFIGLAPLDFSFFLPRSNAAPSFMR